MEAKRRDATNALVSAFLGDAVVDDSEEIENDDGSLYCSSMDGLRIASFQDSTWTCCGAKRGGEGGAQPVYVEDHVRVVEKKYVAYLSKLVSQLEGTDRLVVQSDLGGANVPVSMEWMTRVRMPALLALGRIAGIPRFKLLSKARLLVCLARLAQKGASAPANGNNNKPAGLPSLAHEDWHVSTKWLGEINSFADLDYVGVKTLELLSGRELGLVCQKAGVNASSKKRSDLVQGLLLAKKQAATKLLVAKELGDFGEEALAGSKLYCVTTYNFQEASREGAAWVCCGRSSDDTPEYHVQVHPGSIEDFLSRLVKGDSLTEDEKETVRRDLGAGKVTVQSLADLRMPTTLLLARTAKIPRYYELLKADLILALVKFAQTRDLGVIPTGLTVDIADLEHWRLPGDSLVQVLPFPLGSGGFGKVWVGQVAGNPVNTGPFFAVKQITPSFSAEDVFVDERNMLLAISNGRHPNVCKLIAYVHDPAEGKRWLLLPRYRGGSLKVLLDNEARRGTVQRKFALNWAAEIASALAYLHSMGRWDVRLFHRDVNPENVILSDRDLGRASAVLCDFGAAITADDPGQNTQGFEIPGTRHTGKLAYFPPEVFVPALTGHVLAASSDLFSFGVTLWELFASISSAKRHHPFERTGTGRRYASPYDPVGDIALVEGAELKLLIGRCLDANPGQRPSAAALSQELNGMLDMSDDQLNIRYLTDWIVDQVQCDRLLRQLKGDPRERPSILGNNYNQTQALVSQLLSPTQRRLIRESIRSGEYITHFSTDTVVGLAGNGVNESTDHCVYLWFHNSSSHGYVGYTELARSQQDQKHLTGSESAFDQAVTNLDEWTVVTLMRCASPDNTTVAVDLFTLLLNTMSGRSKPMGFN